MGSKAQPVLAGQLIVNITFTSFSYFIVQNNNNIIMEIERKDLSVGKIRAKELPIVWVLGGPGSGKGSQCEILSYKKNFKHISGGELLRHEVMSGSKIGAKLYKMMEMGELVPTVIMLKNVKNFCK